MRTNIIFFLSTASASMSVLFIPLIAEQMGANRLLIGSIISIYGLMSLVSFYVFGWVSDKKGRVFLIKAGMLLSSVIFLLHLVADNELTLFFVRALCGLSIGVFYSSLVIYGVESGKKLGKYTAYESLGWGSGALIAGLVTVYAGVFILSSVFFFISFLLALRLPEVESEKIKQPLIPFRIIRKNMRIYLPFLLRDIGAFSIWAFLPIYLTELGASPLWMGIIFFVNPGSQFIIKQYVDRINYSKQFSWGLALSALAFYCYALPTSYLWVIPIQFIVAAAWSALSVGAMGSLTHTNPEKATVIGLFSSTRSFARIFSPLIAGVITHYWSFTALMMFAGTITAVGLFINLIKVGR